MEVGTVSYFSINLPEGAEPNTLQHLFSHVDSYLSNLPTIEINDVQGITFNIEIGAEQDVGVFTFFYSTDESSLTSKLNEINILDK